MGLATLCAVLGLVSNLILTHGMEADLYLNKDKFGEFFKLEISEKGCTNVPLNWENQAVSVDTHGSCIKFYDLPYCRGKYVALQPYHGTFQDNLETLAFNKLISSASPCGPKVPTGRYYIQNGADGSVLTVETKNNTPIIRTHQFKPYISKGQQFQVEKVALADYEIIPRVQQNLNPLTFDMSISTSAHPVRRVWKIESVYRGRYLIKNEWNNRCLYKSDIGKVEEHECVTWSPNQEWIFRSIKVKPYFPSKEELKNKPVRPDASLPFEPQDDAFSPVPYQPNNGGFQFPPPRPQGTFPALPPSSSKNKKNGKNPVQIQRPGPLVINQGEPFPPVFPYPILPKVTPITANNQKTAHAPPVPQVRHPGPLPFPAEPVVLDPKKPTISPLDNYNIFGQQQFPNPLAKKNVTTKVAEEDEDRSDEENEDKSDEPNQGQNDDNVSQEDDTPERPLGQASTEEHQGQRPQQPQDDSSRSEEDEEENDEDDKSDEFHEDPAVRDRKRKKQEENAGVNYSDYRLHF